jgi:hypothetical protein
MWAVSGIYLTKIKRFTGIQAAALEGELKFLTGCNSNDGHEERNCIFFIVYWIDMKERKKDGYKQDWEEAGTWDNARRFLYFWA